MANKTQLIDKAAKAAKLSKADVARALYGIVGAITESLKKGDKVALVGFGTFSVASRRATDGRNPRTGAKIKIPASKLPKFKAGKGLKDAVNKKK